MELYAPQSGTKQPPPKGGFCFYGYRCRLACKRYTEKQKNHAQHGGCFVFAGQKLRVGSQLFNFQPVQVHLPFIIVIPVSAPDRSYYIAQIETTGKQT